MESVHAWNEYTQSLVQEKVLGKVKLFHALNMIDIILCYRFQPSVQQIDLLYSGTKPGVVFF